MKEKKEKVTPERAREMLEEDGIEVTAEQAAVIRDFLYEMAEIVVDTFLERHKNA